MGQGPHEGAGHDRPHTTWPHLYERSRNRTSLETGANEGSQGLGTGGWATAEGCRVSVRGHENVLKVTSEKGELCDHTENHRTARSRPQGPLALAAPPAPPGGHIQEGRVFLGGDCGRPLSPGTGPGSPVEPQGPVPLPEASRQGLVGHEHGRPHPTSPLPAHLGPSVGSCPGPSDR